MDKNNASISPTLDGAVHDGEEKLEAHIRPTRLQDYIGQESVRRQMNIAIAAARQRNEALDHVLIYGPPGLGKTTLAHIIANEMSSSLRQTSGPVLEKAGDLAAILTNLEPYDILFVDEIHRLAPAIEEILYPALEDFQLDIMIGEGPSARSVKIELPPFTLVGATTRAGLLTAPLRDRFGILQRLDFYTLEQLTQIVKRSAIILEEKIDQAGAEEISRRSRGTPRIANRLLRRVRDYAQIEGDGIINHTTARAALSLLRVDDNGLDDMDRRLLLLVIEQFNGGPVGVESMAAAVGEERGTLEEVIEPFLIQSGFLIRTTRGRYASKRAWQHFGLTPPTIAHQHAETDSTLWDDTTSE